MRFSDIIGMSITNLWRRKIRTFLTVLGVVIGTASIVVMLSLGIGMRQAMLDEIGTSDSLTAINVSSDSYSGNENALLNDSVVQKFENLEYVESVDPQLWYYMTLKQGQYENMVGIIGMKENALKKIPLKEGTLPGKSRSKLEIIVGNQVITEFYVAETGDYPYWEDDTLPNVDLMNKKLIGEIENEYDGDMGGFSGFDDDDFDSYSSYDDVETTSGNKRAVIGVSGLVEGDETTYNYYSYNCYTELSALADFLKKNYKNRPIPGQPVDKQGKPYRDLVYNEITVNVDQARNVETVLEIIQEMGYRADANKEWLDEVEKEFQIIEAVLGGIGAISLFVAAIGIANTMTMSTYERTKEIGIIKVLGCGLSNIRMMFLTEAAFIGFIGGVFGILLSYGLSWIVNLFGPQFAEEYMYMEGTRISIIPPWLVLLSVVFATIIGMMAGFFPAQRATKLSPLAAIRNE